MDRFVRANPRTVAGLFVLTLLVGFGAGLLLGQSLSVEEPAAFTAMGFKTSEGDPPYASGLKFILVTRENLQSFLNHEHLKGTRATVEAVQYFFKKHYFKIVKP